MRKAILAAIAVLAPVSAWASGDAAAGEKLFRTKCAMCHSIQKDNNRNRPGPTLFGLVGRPAGSVPGYHYSPANKASSKTWDAPTLQIYLADPRTVVPGTKMAFAGIVDQQDRANLIAYLETLH